VPAFLMVSTIRFRSVKAIDLGRPRPYLTLLIPALVIALVASHPRLALVAMSYTYVTFAFVMWSISKVSRRPVVETPRLDEPQARPLE
jgi:phosphatidylserine synthase